MYIGLGSNPLTLCVCLWIPRDAFFVSFRGGRMVREGYLSRLGGGGMPSCLTVVRCNIFL